MVYMGKSWTIRAYIPNSPRDGEQQIHYAVQRGLGIQW
jgi:hypothetical protein